MEFRSLVSPNNVNPPRARLFDKRPKGELGKIRTEDILTGIPEDAVLTPRPFGFGLCGPKVNSVHFPAHLQLCVFLLRRIKCQGGIDVLNYFYSIHGVYFQVNLIYSNQDSLETVTSRHAKYKCHNGSDRAAQIDTRI